MKQARVTQTPRATTREVHISVSAKTDTKAMVINVKVNHQKLLEFFFYCKISHTKLNFSFHQKGGCSLVTDFS